MARYQTSVRTPLTPEEAFSYMADLRNFADWDPGVTRVVQVEGEGGEPGAVFDVTVQAVPKPMTLRYRTLDHQPPTRLLVRAESAMLISVDEVIVEPDGDGSRVSYDAELTLKGPLRILDPLLGVAFERIGDRAATGLRRVLRGDQVRS